MHQQLSQLPRRVKMLVIMAVDAALLALAVWGSLALRLIDFTPTGGDFAWLYVMAPLLGVAVFAAQGTYRTMLRYIAPGAWLGVARGTAITTLLLALLVALTLSQGVPRSLYFLFWALSTALLLGSRYGIRLYYGALDLESVREQFPTEDWTPPNFFIVGAPKCGTTALYEYLKTHPNVFLSHHKEPNYFAFDYPNIGGRVTSLEDYEELFIDVEPHQAAVGEASVCYLSSDAALPALKAFAPDARIIIMVRNPVSMFFSEHSQLIYSFYENEKDPVKAWDLQDARRLKQLIPPSCREPEVLDYRKTCRLGAHIERARQLFGREQVHVIVYEDFVGDTRQVYLDTLRFLGLPDDGRIEFPRVNGSKRHSASMIGQLLISPPGILGRIHRRIRRAYEVERNRFAVLLVRFAYAVLGLLAKKKTKAEARPGPEQYRYILAQMEGDIVQLEAVLGRSFPAWREPPN